MILSLSKSSCIKNYKGYCIVSKLTKKIIFQK